MAHKENKIITHEDIKTNNILMYSNPTGEYSGLIVVYSFNRHGIRGCFLKSGGRSFFTYNELRPIILCKNMFLMLGFQPEVIDSQESIHGFSIKSNKKYNEYYEDLTIKEYNECFNIVDYDIDVKYVHELQNVFSCISKESLFYDNINMLKYGLTPRTLLS